MTSTLKATLFASVAFLAITPVAARAQEGGSPVGSSGQGKESSDTGEVVLRSTDIVVTGKRGKMVNSGGLGARSVLDTPFSVTVVSDREIADRQAITIDEILKSDPAARTASNAVVSIMPEVTVRGLLLDQLNSYKIDGMAFPNRTSLPVEHFQQVELLKGLSGFMYGFGTPGGIVNYITKRPTVDPQLTLGTGFVSDGLWKVTADASTRFGPNGAIGLRVVGVHEQGATYIDDVGHLNRSSISASLSVKLSDTFTFLADGLYQDRRTDGVLFAVYIPAANKTIPMLDPVDGRSNLAESGSFFANTTKVGTVGMDVNIAPRWKANISYRYAEMNAAWREGNANVINAAGDYTFQEFTSPQTHRFNQVQALLIGQFDTGPISHDLTFGASWQQLDQLNDAKSGTFNLVGTSNLYAPRTIVGSFDNPYVHPLFKALGITQKALFASDTITWGKFSVLAGVRVNKFEQTNLNSSGVTTATYNTTPATPTVALRFKPQSGMTLYASYVEALEKGGQASVLNANYGDIFGPLHSKQYEVGFKADKRLWAATMAWFRIERGAEYTNSANVYVQDGLSRYQGVEASLTARPATGFALTAQGMYLDAKLVRAAANVGNRMPGASKWQGSFQAEYAPTAVDGLKLLASVNYNGPSKLEMTNLRTVPSFVTADVSVRYTLPLSTPITLNLAVKNIANEKFWTVRNSGTPALQPGAPRTVALGASIAF